MKRTMTALTIGISAAAFSGAAFSDPEFIGNADVVHASPQYRTVEVARPTTECWTETVNRNGNGHRRGGDYVAPVAGGILGGVAGNQFGRGHGKTAMTVVGALLGGALGNNYGKAHHRQQPAASRVRRCNTVDRYEQQQQLTGYRVKYRYEGQEYYTNTAQYPGKHIPVRVNVSPIHKF